MQLSFNDKPLTKAEIKSKQKEIGSKIGSLQRKYNTIEMVNVLCKILVIPGVLLLAVSLYGVFVASDRDFYEPLVISIGILAFSKLMFSKKRPSIFKKIRELEENLDLFKEIDDISTSQVEKWLSYQRLFPKIHDYYNLVLKEDRKIVQGEYIMFNNYIFELARIHPKARFYTASNL